MKYWIPATTIYIVCLLVTYYCHKKNSKSKKGDKYDPTNSLSIGFVHLFEAGESLIDGLAFLVLILSETFFYMLFWIIYLVVH